MQRRGLTEGMLKALALFGSLSALGATGGLLTGCGFELRRAPPMPFRRLALKQFAPRSAVAAALTAALRGECEIVGDLRQADVVVVAQQDRFVRSLVASSAAGQVRELQLRVIFHFHIETAQGRVLVPLTEMMLSRDMTYNESTALAKELEEAQLIREMQNDIAAQLVRRLASLTL